MLELKVKRYVDNGENYGGPPIAYLQMAWIPADPQTTREEYFYLFNEYEGGDDLDINPSRGLANLHLRLIPINESAQAIITRGAIQVRHDEMAAPGGAWTDATHGGAVRVTGGLDGDGNLTEDHWYTPTGTMKIGDLPISSTTDTTQMCRFDVRVTNIDTEDVIGQSFFLIAPDFAVPSTDMYECGVVYDVPVYDSAGYDGGGESVDLGDIYLDSSILIEVFLMDKDMQETYEEFGIEFTEIL